MSYEDPTQPQPPSQAPMPDYGMGQATPQSMPPSDPFGGPPGPPGNLPPLPGFAPPPPMPPRKKRTGLYVTLIIVVVVLIGAGVTAAVYQPWKNGWFGLAADAKSSQSSGDRNDRGKTSDSKSSKDKPSDKSSSADTDKGVPSDVAKKAWLAPTWEKAKSYMCDDLASKLEKNGSAKKYKAPSKDLKVTASNEEIKGDTATVTITTATGANSAKHDVELTKQQGDWKICKITTRG
ncbi:MAG TPA: hypothetical protein VE172_14995 [Stackebrandtia sp.]|jgi:hypothetical protein|uniref:hypothetical protein n=1 Tax=Stackebrandtia sp. TaxID=2023065 RepID=UPI002D3DF071|nr:hypothetical protein [Stackebrandtia sp.]HZE40112.1 hypothetical protein [Stackebrandtia sp.]